MAEQDKTQHSVMFPSKTPAELKSRLKESYDAIAPRYNAWALRDEALRLKYLDKLLPHLAVKSGPVRVVELGCGSGIPVSRRLLLQPNLTLTANDLSSVQIETAKQNLSKDADRVIFAQGDMMALEVPDQSMDAVVALYSIIHLPLGEQVELLLKITQWLKPGGYLLANFSAEALPGSEMDHWMEEEKGWMFWSGWGAEETVSKVKEAGLEVVTKEISKDVVDASFLWILATKSSIK
jgi:ubiquinone/menaquinone biosynthesis C-methylase UbiE